MPDAEPNFFDTLGDGVTVVDALQIGFAAFRVGLYVWNDHVRRHQAIPWLVEHAIRDLALSPLQRAQVLERLRNPETIKGLHTAGNRAQVQLAISASALPEGIYDDVERAILTAMRTLWTSEGSRQEGVLLEESLEQTHGIRSLLQEVQGLSQLVQQANILPGRANPEQLLDQSSSLLEDTMVQSFDRVEIVLANNLARNEQQYQNTSDTLAQILQHVQAHSNLPSANQPLEKYTDPRLEALKRALLDVRGALRLGGFLVAEAKLAQLEIRADDPPEFHFERLSTLGNIALSRGDRVGAAEYWRDAYAIAPEETRAILNRANAELVTEQPALALPYLDQLEGRNLDDHDRNVAAALKGQALGDSGQTEAFERWFEQHPINGDLMVYSAHRLLLADRDDEARAILEPLCQSAEPDDAIRAALLYAHTVLNTLQRNIEVERPTNIEVVQRNPLIGEALARLDSALALQIPRQEPFYLAQIHVSRTAVLHRAGRITEAMDANQKALEIDPNLPEALQNRVLLLINGDHLDEAISAATQLEDRLEAAVAISLAEALRYKQRFADALPILQRANLGAANATWRSYGVILEIEALLEVHGEPAAQARFDAIPVEARGTIPLAEALLHAARDEADLASSAFQRAIQRPDLIGEVARGYFITYLQRQQRWADALAVFEPLVHSNAPSEHLEAALNMAMSAAAYRRASNICNLLAQRGELSGSAAHYKAFLLELQGRLDEARTVLEDLCARDADPHYQGNLIELLHRQGDRAAARQRLEQLIRQPHLTHRERLASVRLGMAGGEAELVQPICYQLLREHRDDPDVASLFLNMLHHLPEMTVSEAAGGTAVALVPADAVNPNEDDLEWLSIVVVGTCDPARGEIRLESARAQAMLGKKVGDTITEPDAITGINREKRIEQLEPLMYHEGRVLLRSFGRYFPGDRRVRMVRVDPSAVEGLDELRSILAADRPERQELFTVAQEQRWSLEMVGARLGCTALESWCLLADEPGLSLYSSDARIRPVAGGGEMPRVLLDLGSLVFLARFDALTACLGGCEVLYTQFTREQLTSRNATVRPIGHVSVAENGQLMFQSAEGEKEQVESLRERILTFLAAVNAREVGADSILDVDADVIQHLATDRVMLHRFHPAFAARDAGAVLVSEDGLVLESAAADLGVRGARAIDLIDHAADLGLVSREVQCQAWERLLIGRRRYLMPPESASKALMALDNFQFGVRTSQLAKQLDWPDASLAWVARHLLELIRIHVENSFLSAGRSEFVQELLETAWLGKNRSTLGQAVISLGRREPRLLLAWREIEEVIFNWSSQV